MKQKPYTKVLLAFFITAFVSLLFITACNKNEKVQKVSLPDEIAMPAIVNSNPGLKDILGKKIEGSVTIYNLESGEIIIAIKGKNETETRNKFILQTEKTSSYKKGISKINNAEVIYLFDILLLNDLEKNSLTSYSVTSSGFNKTYKLIPKTLKEKIQTNISGFGLGYNSGTWNFLNDNIVLENSIHSLRHGYEKTESDPPGGGSPCTSGGVGSTGCSITGCFESSCTVSCSSGYYSCCYCDDKLPGLGPECNCVPNP